MMPKHSLRAPWGRRLTAMVAVSTLTVAACSDSDSGVGPSSIEVVEIVTLPNNQTLTNLVPGNTRQMLGVPTNSKGNFIDRDVTWQSTNTAAATIDANGLLTAIAGGSTWIKATAGGQTDSIQVGVRYPVGTINLTPATTTLRREGALQLTATTLDTQGATVTGRTVTWTSSDPAVATVSATGLVNVQASPIDGSTTTITATAANASDGGTVVTATRVITVNGDAVVATVTVTAGTGANAAGFRGNTGTNNSLTAVARSGLGNTIVTPITWSTNNAAVATVDAGTGVVTFVGGTGNVTVTGTAVGAGNNGANVSGSVAFEVATTLVSGAPVVGAMDAGTGINWAFNPVGNGFTGFTATTAGGSGDGDLYVIAPGVTNWTTTDAGGSNFVCRSWNSGNVESCTIGTAVAGWYRIRQYSWTPAGNVAGMNLTVTGTP